MLYLLNWTDVFMLGGTVSETELGHYNLAYKLASLSMLVIVSMNVVLAPRVAKLYNNGDLAELHKTVRKATHIIIALTVPLVLFIIILADYLLAFFGHGFAGGRQALIIISIGFLLNAVTGNVDQVLNMTGNQKILQNITIAGFTVNVLLNVVLIPRYGINGAATASLLTNVLFNAACLFYIKNKLGFYTFA
jgi:O-antigen/teichoic acid export membrane protein